ncbi:hypothetical protein ACA910_005669 [Epithemia clementina (nom. ined.)]
MKRNQRPAAPAAPAPAPAVVVVPDWVTYGRQHALELWGEPFTLPEWQHHHHDDDNNHDTNDDNATTTKNDQYRRLHGWQGRDYLHHLHSPVRILEYYIRYGPRGEGLPQNTNNNNNNNDNHTLNKKGGVGTTLTGLVHVTPHAESHRGKTHGGAFCSVMDDVMAWCVMQVSGKCRPWTGYTVQVNTTLLQSIPLDSLLLVQAWVTRIQGTRKVWVQARLGQPYPTKASLRAWSLSSSTRTVASENNPNKNQKPGHKDWPCGGILHAVGEGLVILNKGVLVSQQSPPLVRSRL